MPALGHVDVLVPTRSIDKIGTGDAIMLELIPEIPEMLKKAQYWTSEADRRGRDNMAGIHRLVSRVWLRGQQYNVWIVVREDKGSNRYYYYHEYSKAIPVR